MILDARESKKTKAADADSQSEDNSKKMTEEQIKAPIFP